MPESSERPVPPADGRLLRATVAVAFLAIALIVFFPFLGTRYVTHDDSQVALLRWREIPRASFEGAKVTGRVYFLAAMWFAWIPHAIKSFAYFKAVQLLGLLGNFAALWYLARRLVAPAFASLALLIALATMQARWEHDLVTAFPWAFSTSLTLAMASIALFARWLDGDHPRVRVVSAACYLLSLLTYESFLLYGLVFPLLAWRRDADLRRSIARTAAAIWPHAAVGAVYLLVYVGFRIAFPSGYEGNQMRFSGRAAWAVWTTFTRSALPGTAFSDQTRLFNDFSESDSGYTGGISAVLSELHVEWLVLAVLAVLLLAILLGRAAVEAGRIPLRPAVIVGAVMATVPQIPHALSPRYQAWVAEGTKSHVPTYLASFGVSLLLACGVTAIARLVRRSPAWTACAAAALAWVAVVTAFSNFYVAKSQVIARHRWDLVDAFLASDRFAALPDHAVVLAPSWWHGVEIMNVLDDYWTRYIRRKTGRAIEVVRTYSAFESLCGDGCAARSYFSRYDRAAQSGEQFLLVAPMQGTPGRGLRAPFADVFVLSDIHVFSVFASLADGRFGRLRIDGVRAPPSPAGEEWVRVDRRLDHEAPFRFRLSSDAGDLDAESVILSGYSVGERVQILQPIFGSGFYSEESFGADRWNWAEEHAELILRNDSEHPRDVTVSFVAEGTTPSCHITANSSGKRSTFPGIAAERHIEAHIEAHAEAPIAFESDCVRAPGDPRNLRFNLRLVRVSERTRAERDP